MKKKMELPSPTLREKFPDAFPPLSNPINESTIKRAAHSLRKAIGEFMRHNRGAKLDSKGLFTLVDQTITIFWGLPANLPSDEYRHLFSSVLSESRKPLRLTLRLGSRGMKGRIVL